MRKQTKLVAVASAAALLALGASMTSFAAGWAQEDGEWVYLDKYGDRVYNEWKKSGSDYYYLNDDGVMATDYVVVEEDGNKYYVDSTGKKVTNTWVALDNEEEVLVGENEVDTLWMYFDGKGKAIKDKVKELSYSGGKAKFAFDADGYMLSGWQTVGGKLYYFGDENEGWALTGWQYLEPDEEIFVPYEDSQWFYFDKGVAVQGKTKYINGKYYTFNADGTLDDDWYNAATPASGAKAFASIDGTTGLGWVKAEGISNSDKTYWYYLVNVRDNDKVARGIPFGYDVESPSTTEYVAKTIKSRTYLFNTYGEMQTGLKTLTSDVVVGEADAEKVLEAGIYYFNKAADGVEGQMVTGRFTITEDAEEFYYHFAKNGKAYANQIKDGVLYGENGKRIQAEDGNTYELVTVDAVEVVGKDLVVDGLIAVNANGRVKTSGSIKIDDTYYDVDPASYNVTKRAAN